MCQFWLHSPQGKGESLGGPHAYHFLFSAVNEGLQEECKDLAAPCLVVHFVLMRTVWKRYDPADRKQKSFCQ